MKKKIIVLLVVIAILAPMFVACGGTSTPSPSASASGEPSGSASPSASGAPAEDLNGVTIQWWNSWTSNDGNVMRELVNYYNDNNKDGIKVELDIVKAQALTEKITASLLSNTAPDLYNTRVSGDYVVKKQLVAIDDIWDKTKLQKDDFIEDILNYCYWDGKLYGLPFQISGLFTFFNKDILDKAGVDYSSDIETWEKLIEINKAVLAMNDPNIVPGGIAASGRTDAQSNFCKAHGAQFLEGTTPADFKSLIGTDPKLPDALALLKKQYDEGLFSKEPTSELASAFRGGMVADIVDGAWIIIGAKENKLNFGLYPAPGGPAGRFQNPGCTCVVVLKGCEGKELLATYKFLEYWNDNISEDRLPGLDGKSPVWHWSGTCGYQSYLKSVNNDPDLNKDPFFQTTALISNYFEGGVLTPPAFYKGSAFNNNVLALLFESVTVGGVDIPTAIATADANLVEIIDQMSQMK